MKKRILSMLLTMVMVVGLLPTAAFATEADATQEQTTTVTYSIFDAIIPFENIVDCQRTTYTEIGTMQQVNGFDFPYSAIKKQQISSLVSDVETNPNNYYYRFSEGQNGIVLTMYKYDDSSYSYILSDNGFIQSYGDNCFIYAAGNNGHYGSFVSFRDKEYHRCDSHDSHTTNYPHENQNQLDYNRKDCILCGCGETFIIRGNNPTIDELKKLPMTDGLVEIEHEHIYDKITCKCP